MSLDDIPHTGGCACGAVRYQVLGQPMVTTVCHCRFCQRRLASAFAVLASYPQERVSFTQGSPAQCQHRSDESGRWLRMNFCRDCGTTVSHTAEVRPGMHTIAAGTFDETGWFAVDRHIWVRSKLPWVTIPAGVAAYDQGYVPPAEAPAPGAAAASAGDPAAGTEADAAARTQATQRLLDAPPERVYQAFSQPGQLARWWGPAGFSNEFQAFDFRPGGDWRFVMRSRDGMAWANHNVFDRLEPDRLVVIRHASSPHFVLTVSLQPQGAQTLLVWQQVFASADEARRLAPVVQPANEQNLDRLQRLLAGLAPDAG